MLKRTHLAIGLGSALYFLPHVTHKYTFIPIVLLTSLLPDIDSSSSSMGRRIVFRPLQWFARHRCIIHSFSLCIILSAILALFYPLFAFPFFLGYSLHLFADSFTIQGIRPFWPSKLESKGIVRTGGTIESSILVVIIIVDIALLISFFI
ncbi:MAG: metal-dependent hydrolase [Nanoarchaeota archaeon]|nr:metal-dependent hydrolase [Nanoarchaeota archaeon]